MSPTNDPSSQSGADQVPAPPAAPISRSAAPPPSAVPPPAIPQPTPPVNQGAASASPPTIPSPANETPYAGGQSHAGSVSRPAPRGAQSAVAKKSLPGAVRPKAGAAKKLAREIAAKSSASSVDETPVSGVMRSEAVESRSRKKRWRHWLQDLLGKESRDAPETAGENLAQQEETRRKVPSWLVSFVFHLSLLLILALVPIRQFAQGPFTLFMGDGSAGGLAEFELLGPQTDELQAAELMEVPVTEDVFEPNELLQVELPKLVVSEEETVVEVGETGENEPLINIPYGVENGLIGRTGKLKSQLLSKYGGNADTESAVELGLKWLASQQKSDGSWSLQGPYSEGGASENTTAATALAINAFLGAGYTHKAGKYQSNVKLGLAYLVRRQDSDGFFSDREPSRQQMYAQAIASIAVIEAFGMSGDSELRIAATRAIRFAEWSQSQLKGWRYEPRVDADLSVTGWFVMALVTGKMAGLNIDEELLNSVHQFLDSVSYEEDSRYGYSRFERQPSLSMTAEGMLCRLYLGWSRSNPALLRAIHDDLLPSKPRIDEQDEYSIYYWYYATQVLHHVGGVPWREWNEAMKKTIPTMQIKNGPEKGSWDPSDDVFGPSGGRLYITCLNIYCLEVYYRHLALYNVK